MSPNLIAALTTISLFVLGDQSSLVVPSDHLLAQHEISLNNRQSDKWVNDIFKDNILLNLAYMSGKVSGKDTISWDEVRKPFSYQFKLDPGRTFAYHEDVFLEYQDKVVKTTNAHFNASEGFKSDGYLMGDGVCHLASLIYWVAKDAGLETEARTNHNFAVIPDISREYGVSIYNYPARFEANAKQNLYITNNGEKTITFKFEYQNENLKVSVVESN
ncbi:VanW family protein [Candidatus Microgenomates bacterium]|nr:VanW family protein [Candidatus Microgenomates bacterium]